VQAAPERVDFDVRVALRLQLRNLVALAGDRILQVVPAPADLLLLLVQLSQTGVAPLRVEGRLALAHGPHERVELGLRAGQGLGFLLEAPDDGPGILGPRLVPGLLERRLAQCAFGDGQRLVRRRVALAVLPLGAAVLGDQRLQPGAQHSDCGRPALVQPFRQLRLPGAQHLGGGHGFPRFFAQSVRRVHGAVVLGFATCQRVLGLLDLMFAIEHHSLGEMLDLRLQLLVRLTKHILLLLLHLLERHVAVATDALDQTPQLCDPYSTVLMLPQLRGCCLHRLFGAANLGRDFVELVLHLRSHALAVFLLRSNFLGLLEMRLGEVCLRASACSRLVPLTLQLPDILQGLGVPGCAENVVETLLHGGGVLQRPRRLLLVAKNHALQDRLGHAHQLGHLVVHVDASVTHAGLGAVLAHGAQHRLERFVLGADAPGHPAVRELERPDRADLLVPRDGARGEEHPNLRLHLRQSGDLQVVQEAVPIFCIGRQDARGGHFEAFDDGGLARAIGPNDQRHRPLEIEHLQPLVVEATDPLDAQLGDGRHAQGHGASPS